MTEKYLPKRGDLIDIDDGEWIGFVVGWSGKDIICILEVPELPEIKITALRYYNVRVLAKKEELQDLENMLPKLDATVLQKLPIKT